VSVLKEWTYVQVNHNNIIGTTIIEYEERAGFYTPIKLQDRQLLSIIICSLKEELDLHLEPYNTLQSLKKILNNSVR